MSPKDNKSRPSTPNTSLKISVNYLNCKRKNNDNLHQEDIMNAALTSSNGYMTRNKLKKQKMSELDNNEFECDIINKSSKNNKRKTVQVKSRNIKNCSNKSQFSLKRKSIIPKDASNKLQFSLKNQSKNQRNSSNKLQSGYVFTYDISHSPPHPKKPKKGTNKRTPLLFESESDLEIDIFPKDCTKILDEVECVSNHNEEDISSLFDKNCEVKTYFNKKTHLSSINIEENNKSKTFSSISNRIQNCNSSFRNEEISKTETVSDGLLNVTGLTTSHGVEENSIDDDSIVVSEEYIRLLEKELQTENMDLKDSQNNICMDVTNVDVSNTNMYPLSCYNSLIEQDETDNKPQFKTCSVTENNLFSIFDIPNECTLVENCVNRNEIVIPSSNSETLTQKIIQSNILQANELENNNSDSLVENHISEKYKVIEEKNTSPVLQNKINSNMNVSNLVITNQYIETDIVNEKESRSGIYIDKIEDDCLMDNDNLSFEIDNSPKTLKTNQSNICDSNDDNDDKCKINMISNCFNSLFEQDKTDIQPLSFEKTIVQNNMCIEDIDVDIHNKNIYSLNGFNSSINQEKTDNKPQEFKTTNITENKLLHICDIPKECTLVESYINSNEIVIGNSNSEILTKEIIQPNILQTNEFENNNSVDESHIVSDKYKVKEENNTSPVLQNKIISNMKDSNFVITNQCFKTDIDHNKKRKSEIFINKIEDDCLINNEKLSCNTQNSPMKLRNYSKCNCNTFSFNEKSNKKFTSRTENFSFNYIARNIRQKLLHQKQLEANILKSILNQDMQNIIQSDKFIPIFISKSINKQYTNSTNVQKKDHVKSNMINNEDKKNSIQSEKPISNVISNSLSEKYEDSVNIKKNDHVVEPNSLEDMYITKNKKNSIQQQKLVSTFNATIPNNVNNQSQNSINIQNNDHAISSISIMFNSEGKKNFIIQSEKHLPTFNLNYINKHFENAINIKDNNIELSKSNMINTEDNKNVIDSEEHKSTFISKSINKKYENFIQSETLLPAFKSNCISKQSENSINLKENNDVESSKSYMINTESKNNVIQSETLLPTIKPNYISTQSGNFIYNGNDYTKPSKSDNMIITEDKKNVIQSKKLKTTFISKSINKKYENFIQSETLLPAFKLNCISKQSENSINIKENNDVESSKSYMINTESKNNVIQSETLLPTFKPNFVSKQFGNFINNENDYTKPSKSNNMIITEDKKNVIQSKKLNPTFISKSIDKKYENFIQSEICLPNFKSNRINKQFENSMNLKKNDNVNLSNKITIDNKNNTFQSEKLLPINNYNEKCNNQNENDHIEPTILNVFKDVYVDFEYLTEDCDYREYNETSAILQNASKKQLMDNKYFIKIDDKINNKPINENYIKIIKNKNNIATASNTTTKSYDENINFVPTLFESETKKNILKLPQPPCYKNLLNNGEFEYVVNSREDKHLQNSIPERGLFDLPSKDIDNLFSDSSSDDENRLQIEDHEDNSTFVYPSIDSSKDISFADKNKINEEPDLSNKSYENLCATKEEKCSLSDSMVMTNEMCIDSYEKRSLHNVNNKNDYFSKTIEEIFTEMYVDKLSISMCQHMIELSDDDNDVQLKTNDICFQIDKKNVNISSEKIICENGKTETDENKMQPKINKSISINAETVFKTDFNSIDQKYNKASEPSNIQKKVKSNLKIRILFREFIESEKPLNEILESKEFRNLRHFKEEEIACSIGVFLFEKALNIPIINGLSEYRKNFQQLTDEEKHNILKFINLNISYPTVAKLTSITLALAKMLGSNKLIDLILNNIRKNLFKNKMNNMHSFDFKLITQTTYFVDICFRLGLLNTLLTFIFDSMVLLPNKYCCIIFVSLLLWKNFLPIHINDKHDPVIITVISYLIAKKKYYAEQTIGCDIFQRELINLLSCHFNYSFSLDLPINFIQHIHKPDFVISMILFLQCCHPKDLVEFLVNCLFPIIEDYLNTQQNENYALKIMESINMGIKPFKISCNTIVSTYLNKCKQHNKDEKELIYNITYNSYKIIQNKFVEYFNDSRPRSQLFEESLVSIIMLLGSVDYLNSCTPLLKWKPTFQLSTIFSKKMYLFKSILGNFVWDELSTIEDTTTIKCIVNSYLVKKDIYNTILRLHALR